MIPWQQFNSVLLADLARYQQAVRGLSFFRCYCRYPGFRYSFWLRAYDASRHPLFRLVATFSAWRLRRLSLLTGIQINPGTTIGPGLYIPHHGTIVVNPGTTIGKNCYLSHTVTIGKVHSGLKAGVPKIGDDVFIGTGAVVLGNILIGDESAIGVNSVVLDDVPSGVFAGGVPAKVIISKGKQNILGQTEDVHA